MAQASCEYHRSIPCGDHDSHSEIHQDRSWQCQGGLKTELWWIGFWGNKSCSATDNERQDNLGLSVSSPQFEMRTHHHCTFISLDFGACSVLEILFRHVRTLEKSVETLYCFPHWTTTETTHLQKSWRSSWVRKHCKESVWLCPCWSHGFLQAQF